MEGHTEYFGENEDQDHADEETRLLRTAADAGVTDDADGEAGIISGDVIDLTDVEIERIKLATPSCTKGGAVQRMKWQDAERTQRQGQKDRRSAQLRAG